MEGRHGAGRDERAATRDDRPLVSVIIANYRGEALLPPCLDSLRAQDTDRPFEVIVVDDGSDDGSAELVRSRYPEARLLVNARNVGPAAAKNIGASQARGDYLAFLDNDVELHPSWMRYMLEAMASGDEALGACASHIMLNGHSRVLNSTGGLINLLGYAWDRGIFKEDSGTYAHATRVMYACTAAMMISKGVFEELGGFDRRYRYLFEDVDLGWRMNIRGYRVAYEPRAVARHLLSSTMGRRRLRNQYLYERNRMRAMIKNMEADTLKLIRREFFFWFGQRMRSEMESGLTARQKVALPLRMAQAVAWNLFWLPDTLRLRKETARNRAVSDQQLISAGVLCPQIGEPPVGVDPRGNGNGAEVMAGEVEIGSRADMARVRPGALGEGWYGPETDARGVSFRWTAQRATVFLRAGRRTRHLCVRTVMAHPEGLSRVAVRIDGRQVSNFEVPNEYHVHRIPLPRPVEPGVRQVELRVENPFRPRDVLRVEDHRTLGIAVAYLGLH
ncbi:MAG: glycosyltransferase family 2 protein [Actinobacteria bacterium]|nr:glycosyltransferase family 2 protein [Actinomycetota bacterium]